MPHRRSQVAGNGADPPAVGRDCLPCSPIVVEDTLCRGRRAALSAMTGIGREEEANAAKQSQFGSQCARKGCSEPAEGASGENALRRHYEHAKQSQSRPRSPRD